MDRHHGRCVSRLKFSKNARSGEKNPVHPSNQTINWKSSKSPRIHINRTFLLFLEEYKRANLSVSERMLGKRGLFSAELYIDPMELSSPLCEE